MNPKWESENLPHACTDCNIWKTNKTIADLKSQDEDFPGKPKSSKLTENWFRQRKYQRTHLWKLGKTINKSKNFMGFLVWGELREKYILKWIIYENLTQKRKREADPWDIRCGQGPFGGLGSECVWWNENRRSTQSTRRHRLWRSDPGGWGVPLGSSSSPIIRRRKRSLVGWWE